MKIDTTEEDKEFRDTLLTDIGYFHELYAKDNDRRWLEIAVNIGTAAANLKRK